jgi:hypothetical protein
VILSQSMLYSGAIFRAERSILKRNALLSPNRKEVKMQTRIFSNVVDALKNGLEPLGYHVYVNPNSRQIIVTDVTTKDPWIAKVAMVSYRPMEDE